MTEPVSIWTAMRDAFREAFLAYGADTDTVFLTGDLGFQALEPIRDVMGERFINCGVAEQNTMSVAAALASKEFKVYGVQSIASFCVLRPFEQIRNDIALHRLPVQLVGNGGGFGYGVMGPTHHAIEDYALLLTLPNFKVYVPAFDVDLAPNTHRDEYIQQSLLSEAWVATSVRRTSVPPAYAPWRRLVSGNGPVIVACGPISGSLIETLSASSRIRSFGS